METVRQIQTLQESPGVCARLRFERESLLEYTEMVRGVQRVHKKVGTER